MTDDGGAVITIAHFSLWFVIIINCIWIVLHTCMIRSFTQFVIHHRHVILQ